MSRIQPALVPLAAHPRAAGGIRRAKAAAGLAGFGLAVAATLLAGGSFTDALWRGLLGGIAGNLVGWVAGLVWWQAILHAEARATVRAAVEAREQRLRDRRRGSEAA